MSKTKEYLNRYLDTKPEKTRIKIRKMIDRDEVYRFEEKLGKTIFEMDVDEIIAMLQTFNRRSRGKTKISYRTMDAIISLFRGLFNWYIENVEVVKNPFNSKKLRGRSAEIFYTEVKTEKISKEKIEKTVTIRGKEHQLSDRLYGLLVKIHNMEYLPAYRGEYVMVSFDGSYFKFPTRASFVDVERESAYWQMYISRLFKNKINTCFDFDVNYRNVYLCGLYEKIAEKYGREKTNEMITSVGDGDVNIILEKEAYDYGALGVSMSPSYIKKILRVCMIPD